MTEMHTQPTRAAPIARHDGGGGGGGDASVHEHSGDKPPTIAEESVAALTELQQLQKTHDEYVKSSCEYEKELESELERCEARALTLEQSARVAELARDELSTRLGEMQTQLAATQQREAAVLADLEAMKWKIQRLEQANDELETAARIAQASIADLEHRSETLLEQHVFLSIEKDELARQLASVTVAPVHPVPSSHSSSALVCSEKASAPLAVPSLAAPTSTSVRKGGGGGKSKKGRYPDVVESCLHITCRKCRAGHSHARHHRHASGALASSLDTSAHKRGAAGTSNSSSLFDRLRLRFRALFDCSDAKRASSSPVAT